MLYAEKSGKAGQGIFLSAAGTFQSAKNIGVTGMIGRIWLSGAVKVRKGMEIKIFHNVQLRTRQVIVPVTVVPAPFQLCMYFFDVYSDFVHESPSPPAPVFPVFFRSYTPIFQYAFAICPVAAVFLCSKLHYSAA